MEGPELVRTFYAAWNERGVAGVHDAHWADDIEGREDPMVPDATVYRGHAGMLEWMRHLTEVFGEFKVHPREILQEGDRYLVTLQLEGVGAGSGVPVDEPIFHVLDVNAEGKIARLRNFLDRERALAALRETSTSDPAGSP